MKSYLLLIGFILMGSQVRAARLNPAEVGKRDWSISFSVKDTGRVFESDKLHLEGSPEVSWYLFHHILTYTSLTDAQRELSPEDIKKVLAAVCAFFEDLKIEELPHGKETETVETPSGAVVSKTPDNCIKLTIELYAEGLHLSYTTAYIPKSTKLPPSLVSLLRILQPYNPVWLKPMLGEK